MSAGRIVLAAGGSASVMAIDAGSLLFAIVCSTQWCAYPLLCNTVEYGEWKNGFRQEGMIMSANSFGSESGTAIGTALCSWVLAWTGYNGAVQEQTSSAILGISIVYVVLPIALNVICIVIALRMCRPEMQTTGKVRSLMTGNIIRWHFRPILPSA